MDGQRWVPKHNPWLIAVVVSMATFMEVLDTSVANVALPHIAGSLGVGQDESTWVLTSYLVSNGVVLPIAAYISTLIGRKRFYMICVLLFGISSLLCGLAPTLPLLLLFRVLQGAGGGGLGPRSKPFWPTPSHRRSVVRPSRSMAWLSFSLRQSDLRWAAGSRTTSIGAGSFLSTSRSSHSHCISSTSWSKIRRQSRKR